MLLDQLVDAHSAEPDASPVRHVEFLRPREARRAPWPSWVPQQLKDRLRQVGIHTLWEHQARAAELAYNSQHVVISTGTASGKSLAYQLPVVSSLLSDKHARAVYLAPTKALAVDQLNALEILTDEPIGTYDGDTPTEERDWVRTHAKVVFTNPDMLHKSILPGHTKWRSFFRGLKYVVVDECHSYRGVFGSHVAHILRRLRRLCEKYGSSPTFLLASATVAEPEVLATRLTGCSVKAVEQDASIRSGGVFALWEPEFGTGIGENGAPLRQSALMATAELLAKLVRRNTRTLAFVRSRRGAEVVALTARNIVQHSNPELVDRIAAYRGGYLAEERRAVEKALNNGDLLGVATTNALEVGMDISGLDAVLLCGYPGTLASLWQQAGRAGRGDQRSLVIFIARDEPLDTYLVHHPEAVFGRPVEATVLDPDNPHVLGPQLCCAAADTALGPGDLPLFGERSRERVSDLAASGLLRQRLSGWYWTRRARPLVDIRGTGVSPYVLVEGRTGQILGTVDAHSVHTTVHPGAVYLHQGTCYIVDHLDLDEQVVLLHAEQPDWTTFARDTTDIGVVGVDKTRVAGDVTVHLGTVEVTNQVISYIRRRLGTNEILAEHPLDLPPRTLLTRAVWYTASDAALARSGIKPSAVPGSAHAAEHAAIGLLPLFATCDRWDIGGVSTACHPDTGRTTVFVYDGYDGGAGFAERGYNTIQQWLRATRSVIASCPCEAGCPSCVQSPKCGNRNEPLDKDGGIKLLEIVDSSLSLAP